MYITVFASCALFDSLSSLHLVGLGSIELFVFFLVHVQRMDMENFQLFSFDVALLLCLSPLHNYVASDKCSDPCVWVAILSKFR